MKEYTDLIKVNNFREILNHAITVHGDKNIFKFKKRMYKKGETPEFNYITFKEFGKNVEALGSAILKLGLSGKRIAIISKNRYEWIESYYAITTSGACVVPLDKALPNNEIISLLERSEVEAVIFEEKYSDVMKTVREENMTKLKYFINMDLGEDNDFLSYKKMIEDGKDLIRKGDKTYSEVQFDENAMSIMLFTSGTTSISKAAMLSQKNICENLNGVLSVVKINDTDCTLAVLPFHHALPTIIMHAIIYSGVCYCFCDGLKYIAQNLAEYECTIFIAVPAIIEVIYKRIIKQIEKQGKTKLVNGLQTVTNFLDKLHINLKKQVFKDVHQSLGGHMRLIISGAAPIDKEILKGLQGFGIRTIQGYGLTETSPIVSIENDFDERVGSSGKPLPNLEVKIEDKDEKGNGEILVKGPNVMLGYYKNDEANKESLVDGWYHTGDLGYLDKDGFLYITGRKKNVIVQKNGKNIYPEELEILISHIPFVKECIVYGKPTWDDDLDVCVKIVYDKNEIKDTFGYVSEERILEEMKAQISRLNDRMPPYKHIRDVLVTDEELIKTTTNKVKRFEEIEKILSTKA